MVENYEQKLKLSVNSPVVLWFSIICLGVLIAEIISQGTTTTKSFSVYRSSLTSPLTCFALLAIYLDIRTGSIFFGIITLLLVVGPMLEL